MKRTLLGVFLSALSAFGQYKLENAGPPPATVASAFRDTLQKQGVKIAGPDGSVYCQVWLRASAPKGGNSEDNVTLSGVPHGALLGIIQFSAAAQDRRGQPIKPGLYTMRYSFFPVDGSHQGVAPQRDFAILTPAADDTDPAALPKFEQLMAMSRKASGTAHPAVLSVWKAETAQTPAALKQEGEDWTLYTALGDTPLAIILVGVHVG